jgi:hypothetical protein
VDLRSNPASDAAQPRVTTGSPVLSDGTSANGGPMLATVAEGEVGQLRLHSHTS